MLDLAIVIVQYNVRDLLRDCLRSVFASVGDFSYTVTVVDSCSTDGSADMVAAEFPQARLIRAPVNGGYPYANNLGLRAVGFRPLADEAPRSEADALNLSLSPWPPSPPLVGEGKGGGGDEEGCPLPRFALLLNPDTLLPPTALADMLDFMAAHPQAGAAGPRLVLADGSLDLACRRGEPTLATSFYRLTGLSRLFPRSPRFGRYNMTYLPEDQLAQVDSVVGAFMLVRAEAIEQVGLLDEQFFMYGEDLDWAKRIREADWEVWYNPGVVVRHYKRQSSRQNPRAAREFKRAELLFYRKHYAADTPAWLRWLVLLGFGLRGGPDLLREAWRKG